jgi:hypothetical protein
VARAGAPELCTVHLCKIENPGTNVDYAFFFLINRMVNPCGKFSEPGVPHNFAKNDRQDLKWAVRMRLDASYNLCSKLGSK